MYLKSGYKSLERRVGSRRAGIVSRLLVCTAIAQALGTMICMGQRPFHLISS